MSVRRLGNQHTLPDNPQWLEFPRSDGSKATWPRNTEKVVDHEGQVNFMRTVGIDESLCIHWRKHVGTQVAKALGKPEGPNYVLKDWPTDYCMFDHNKGKESNPRHDPYLYGTTLAPKFRSANEFVPHAIWLFTDETLNKLNCECKYCSKKSQRLVSESFGLSQKRSVGSPTPSAVRSNKLRERQKKPQPLPKKKPYTAVRRALRAPKRVPGPKQVVVPERSNDVHQSLRKSDVFRPRLFRQDELIWCAINPPISSSSGVAESSIPFWPGIVEDLNLKAVPITMESASANGDSPAWKVQQWTIYKVKLLGCNHFCSVTDMEALPYLAYAPSEALLQGLRDELVHLASDMPLEEMEVDKLDQLYDFDPTGSNLVNDLSRYRKAVAPYTLAVQIASQIASYWTPTDEWDYKFTIPPSIPQPTPQAVPDQSQSLHTLISAAMASNAHQQPPPPPPQQSQLPYQPPDASGNSSLPPEELRSLQPDSFGQYAWPTSIPRTVTQLRYQGMWWGAERIWTDELVRLKMSREQFAPNGSAQVFPPSGPSSTTVQEDQNMFKDKMDDTRLLGARQKGLFMKLDGIFVVDAQGPDGTILKECRASGMLYELADDDWVEPSPPGITPDIKGKGKARDEGDVPSPVSATPAQDLVSQTTSQTVPSFGPNGQTGPEFMQGPSPLKPPPLPNPNPSVPTSETVADVLSQTTKVDTAAPQQDGIKDKSQVSRPVLSLTNDLPPPPEGFKFRSIVPDGNEVVVSVSLISGRYYPGLFEHPLLKNPLETALAAQRNQVPMIENRRLWALEGLMPGAFQSMDPSEWRPNRNLMFNEAIADAKQHFAQKWSEMKNTRVLIEQDHGVDADAEGDVDMEDLFGESASTAGR
ncbi:unnamed protein product [Somion occarium]|uniref:Cryptic loci regulator 2 N-terminal domain-containing protein n=1 Tax=Somion occarium TaxID=3059160 RepID=A0ABP1E4W7_9APHY